MRSKSLIASFDFAIEGIVYALRTQRNMRLHSVAAVVVFLAALFFRIGPLEFIALTFAIAFVFITELANTSLEAVVDLVTEGFDPLAKTAKDVAAGAVLIAAVNAVMVGYVVFYKALTQSAETLLRTVGETPTHLTVIALLFTSLAVLAAKAMTRSDSFLHGGWPSGHTALATSAAVAIAYSTRSAPVTVLALFIAALVGQSRIEAHIHTIPQVLLGALLGFLLTTAVFQLFLQ